MRFVGVVRENYGLKVREVRKLEGGFRNQCFRLISDKGKFVLIIYKNDKDIKTIIQNAHLVAKFLSEKNLPTRIPIVTERGREYFRYKFADGYHYAALYNFLEGETIPWEGYTRRHLKSIGKTLSDMPYTFLKFQNSQLQLIKTKLPKWKGITRNEMSAMRKYFKEVEPWILKKLKVSLNWKGIQKTFGSIEQQIERSNEQENILHYDFVRGNILFSRKLNKALDIYPIIGILDFEKVCLGPEVADIARTLAFLIIDCKFKDEETIRKRFLLSGYDKRGKNKLPFSEMNNPFLESLLKFFWLRDFWKFLVHSPYEYLYMNEHYVRTRDRLVKVNLLQ